MASEGPPLVSGLDNIHLYVRDMERSRAFYGDLLGLSFAGDEHWLKADLGGVRFALHPDPGGLELSSGTVSINFAVGDADAAAEQLRAAGVEAREQMREEYGIPFEITDPDGYRIYLFQAPNG